MKINSRRQILNQKDICLSKKRKIDRYMPSDAIGMGATHRGVGITAQTDIATLQVQTNVGHG